MGLVAESILGDNEHSNMDSDDLVPSLQVSGVSGTGGGGD